MEGAQPPPSAVPGGSATLTAEPCASGPPLSVGNPVPEKQHLAGLVERDRQHVRVVPEDLLDAVTVVDVDVDVSDALDARSSSHWMPTATSL